jgi:transcriptional regulator with XRE-family HTH domain
MKKREGAHLSAVVDKSLGGKIRDRREAVGLDQAQLAREAGIGRTTLHNIETGVSGKPTTIAKVLRALEAAEEESGVQIVPSEKPETETIEFEVEGLMGVKVVRARGPKADREQLREDVIAIIQAISQGESRQQAVDEG